MPNTIQHKRSSEIGKVPTTAQLSLGEVAINTNDGKIYIKKNVGGIESIVLVNAVSSVNSQTGDVTLNYASVGAAKAIAQDIANLYVTANGSDITGTGTIDTPYLTIAKACTIAQGNTTILFYRSAQTPPSGNIVVPVDNLLIVGQGVNGNPNCTYSGGFSTSGSTTGFGVKDVFVNAGSGICLSFADTSGGHVFDNVRFGSTNATPITAVSGFNGVINFVDCDFSLLDNVINLPALSGAGIVNFVRCKSLRLSVNQNWTVNVDSCEASTLTINSGATLNIKNVFDSTISGAGTKNYLEVKSVNGQTGIVSVPALQYDTSSQNLNATQQQNARTNLGLGSAATKAETAFISSTDPNYYKAVANGIASLGSDGKVPAGQLPTTAQVVNTVNGQSGNVIVNTVGEIKILPDATDQGAWMIINGRSLSRTAYSALFSKMFATVGVCTISNANPAVVTFTAHGLVAGDRIYFTTTGTLPTGINVNTAYYVRSTNLTANSFTISATYEGTAIATSTAGSGTHTLLQVKNGFGLGDGSTTFTLPVSPAGRALAVSGSGSGLTARSSGLLIGTETHTLSVDEMASHNHRLRVNIGPNLDLNAMGGWVSADYGMIGGTDRVGTYNNAFRGLSTGGNQLMETTGTSQPHNNVQPTFFYGSLFIFTGVYP